MVWDSLRHVEDFSLYPVGCVKSLEGFNHRGDTFNSVFLNDQFGACLKSRLEEAREESEWPAGRPLQRLREEGNRGLYGVETVEAEIDGPGPRVGLYRVWSGSRIEKEGVSRITHKFFLVVKLDERWWQREGESWKRTRSWILFWTCWIWDAFETSECRHEIARNIGLECRKTALKIHLGSFRWSSRLQVCKV